MYYTLVIIACKCMHLFHCLCYCVNGPEAQLSHCRVAVPQELEQGIY